MEQEPALNMATDTTPPANPAAMEDILSSIRTTMAEETAKVGSGSTDLIDAAAAQDGAEEDVLELSAADMVATPAAATETAAESELIDIAAFANSGETKPVSSEAAAALATDILGEPAPEVVAEAPPAAAAAPVEGAADEFDRLLAEISQEQQQQVAASEVTKQALMAEEEPLGSPAAGEETLPEPRPEPVAGAASYSAVSLQGPEGVQIAFPAEVLALALRPMVQDWLTQNLPGVVEKLVREEISKLTQT